MRLLALLVFVAMLSGCGADSPSAPSGPVNVQVVLAPGQTADVANAAIRIRFVGVMGDSRCPLGVFCIQGGDAIVRVDVLSTSGGQATFDLHTGSLQPARYGDLTIELVELTPYPFSSGPIAPGDYRATLKITR